MSNSSDLGIPKIQLFKKDGFSERNGLIGIRKVLQMNGLDSRARIAIYNETIKIMNSVRLKFYYQTLSDEFVKYLYCDILYRKVDDLPYYSSGGIIWEEVEKLLSDIIINYHYADVFTLIESITEFFNLDSSSIQNYYNEVFEHENIGYRLVNSKITDIVDECEINEIEQVCNRDDYSYTKHIDKSIKHLYDRGNPDYENSIKESISAVEDICQVIAGKKCTLTEALNCIERKGAIIHPALKTALKSLYGYSSDEKGIRHADCFAISKPSFVEAKFMLVVCSAFINYLITLIE